MIPPSLYGIPLVEYKSHFLHADGNVPIILIQDEDENLKKVMLPPKLYWWIRWDIMPFEEAVKRCNQIIKCPELKLDFDWQGFNELKTDIYAKQTHDHWSFRPRPRGTTFR